MDPLVSIIIPTYNREDLIGETLNSLIGQTYTNWECIVVDDGSYDNTEAIVKTYLENEIRIKLYSRPAERRKGASVCRNYGLENSRGDLVQFLDSDDLLAKNKLEEQIKLYQPGDLSLITCKWGGFEQSSNLNQRFKYKYESYRNFKKGKDLLQSFGKYNEFFPLHVYLIPKNLIDKSGYWNESLTNNDDAEFFTRLILTASIIRFTPKTSVYYRYTNTAKLSDFNSEEKVKSAIKSWKLIENHIKDKYPNSKIKYIRTAKLNLYNSVKNKFPEIVNREMDFFEGRKVNTNCIYQLLKKFKILFIF